MRVNDGQEPTEELLTTAEAADILGLSQRTVQHLVKTGEIPVIRKVPGGRGSYLLGKSDVVHYAEDHTSH